MNSNQDFDWVTALSSCSARKVFETLVMQVSEDVKIRNALRQEGERYKFDIVREGDRVTVFIDGNAVSNQATFRLDNGRLLIEDKGGTLLHTATLTLNDEGECRLKIKGKE